MWYTIPDLSSFLTLSLGWTNLALMVLKGFIWTETPALRMTLANDSERGPTYGSVMLPLEGFFSGLEGTVLARGLVAVSQASLVYPEMLNTRFR